MNLKLQRLTEVGIARFREYLNEARNEGDKPFPINILDDSEAVANAPELELPGFPTKRAAAEYLVGKLSVINGPQLMADVGVWTWLAAYYFDDVCPVVEGKRKPKADPHYIFDAQDYRRCYRHLIRTPYQILKAMPDHNRLYLDHPLDVHGETIEQTISKLYLMRLGPVRSVVDKLYIDETTGKPKRGLFNKRENAKPGDLRNRLPIRLLQLMKTYDVAGVSAEQLLELLGKEFSGWYNISEQVAE